LIGARHSVRRRLIGWGLFVIGLVAVGLAGFTAYQALQAHQELRSTAKEFSLVEHQLRTGDVADARSTVRRAQRYARQAHDHTQGPGWWIAAHLPVIGDDTSAIRTVADVVDDVSSRVLPDVVDAGDSLRPERLHLQSQRVDLAPIARVAPTVVRFDRRLSRDSERVAGIQTSGLTSAVASPVRQLRTKLADASALSDTLSRAVRLLPPMLGADGPRTYLLMFQNNAEARSTGGIPGSFAIVHARDGMVTLGEQSTSSALGSFARPVIPLTAQERALFGDKLGRSPQGVTLSPDFARSAKILAAMWQARRGARVDGVASADPVALSHLLEGTGPVLATDGHQLDASNVVTALLSGVYAATSDPAAQDAFFEKAAGSVFDVVSAGRGDPARVLRGLTTSVRERRVLLWSRRPAEQALLSPTDLGGGLTNESSAASPQVGVFLNDVGASKLDYYLDYRVDVASHGCQAHRQSLTVTMHLRSLVPKRAAGLPASVVNHTAGAPRGQVRLSLLTYAPVDGTVRGARIGGRPARVHAHTHDGRMVLLQRVRLAPGQRQTLTWQMTGGQGQTDPTSLRVTPGARTSGVGKIAAPHCS
jgi:hypothetical protein